MPRTRGRGSVFRLQGVHKGMQKSQLACSTVPHADLAVCMSTENECGSSCRIGLPFGAAVEGVGSVPGWNHTGALVEQIGRHLSHGRIDLLQTRHVPLLNDGAESLRGGRLLRVYLLVKIDVPFVREHNRMAGFPFPRMAGWIHQAGGYDGPHPR
eukprot:scaffold1800_cov332-Pavlova_lutheri.AAC.15